MDLSVFVTEGGMWIMAFVYVLFSFVNHDGVILFAICYNILCKRKSSAAMDLFSGHVFLMICTIVQTTVLGNVSGQLQRGRRAGDQPRKRSAVGEDTCKTASLKSGSCIPLIRCRQFWGRSNIPDMTNSTCGDETSSRVCCPMMEDTNSTMTTDILAQESTNTPPVTNPSRSTTDAPLNLSNSDKSRRGGKRNFSENCGRSGTTFSRIVGGQDSALGAWPWMAVIYIVKRGGAKSPECGGSLVTASHVVTAAHCVVTRRGNTFSPRQMLVRLGELDLRSDRDGARPVDVRVRTIIKHAQFNLRTFQNDIAILELLESVEMNEHISTICLPFDIFSELELVNRNAIAIGWGSTRYGGPSSPILQEVQLRIWKNSLCLEVFKRDVPITDVNLCAGDGDKDACRGDSGGPLMLPDETGKFYLIGIVSFGKKCAEPGIPGVYTRVTEFVDWIEEKIG